MSQINQIMEQGKLPPQAIEFEEAVLGAILLERDAFDNSNILRPEYFYLDTHQTIYSAIVDLFNANKPIDILTLTQKLKEKEQLDLIGGAYTIAKLTAKVSSAANVEYYTLIIVQKYNLREIIRISAMALTEAFNDNADPFEIQSVIFNGLENNHVSLSSEPELMGKVVKDRVVELAEIQSRDSRITGIDTGFHSLNEVGHGWQTPDMVVMAARPGEGKTASALNFALNIALQNTPIAFFSLEMSKTQLIDRLISIMTGISGDRIKTADITEANWQTIHGANFNLPFHIDDTPSLSVIDFKIKARKLKRKHGIKMIFIDYLQLMTASVKGNREQEISHISRNIKAMAKELKVPIMALAQLSRAAETNSGRPKLSHLRESGSIEQDADIVIFLHNENSEDKTITSPPIEFIYAKHRAGANKIKTLIFNKITQKLAEL